MFNARFIRDWGRFGQELDQNRVPVEMGWLASRMVSGVKPVDEDREKRLLNEAIQAHSSNAHSLEQAMALLRDVDAVVYTIGIGKKVERDFLERLALVSGGEAYFPDDVSSLAFDFRRIVENLRRRYIVTYTSTNPVRDGSWRAVEIRTSLPNVIVKSRGAYSGPSQ